MKQNLAKYIKLAGMISVCASAIALVGCQNNKGKASDFSLAESINNSASRPYKPLSASKGGKYTTFPSYTPKCGTLTIETTNKTLVNQDGKISQLNNKDTDFGKTGPFDFGDKKIDEYTAKFDGKKSDLNKEKQDTPYNYNVYENTLNSANIDNYNSYFKYEWTPELMKYSNSNENVAIYNDLSSENILMQDKNKWYTIGNNVFNNTGYIKDDIVYGKSMPTLSPLYWAMTGDIQGFQEKHVLQGFTNAQFKTKHEDKFMTTPIDYSEPYDFSNSKGYLGYKKPTKADVIDKNVKLSSLHLDKATQYPSNSWKYPINGYEKPVTITSDFKNLPDLNVKKLTDGKYSIKSNRKFIYRAKMSNPDLVANKDSFDYIVHVKDELVTKNNKLVSLNVNETFTPTKEAKEAFKKYAKNKKIYLKSSTLKATLTDKSQIKRPVISYAIVPNAKSNTMKKLQALNSLGGWNFATGQDERNEKELNSKFNYFTKLKRKENGVKNDVDKKSTYYFNYAYMRAYK